MSGVWLAFKDIHRKKISREKKSEKGARGGEEEWRDLSGSAGWLWLATCFYLYSYLYFFLYFHLYFYLRRSGETCWVCWLALAGNLFGDIYPSAWVVTPPPQIHLQIPQIFCCIFVFLKKIQKNTNTNTLPGGILIANIP